jgi:multisubunit Na+/H+ antiporter MnhB subunit
MASRDRTVIATTTLLSSMAFYQYAKAKGKSEVPYLMIGAFVGAIVAELALLQMSKNQQR